MLVVDAAACAMGPQFTVPVQVSHALPLPGHKTEELPFLHSLEMHYVPSIA